MPEPNPTLASQPDRFRRPLAGTQPPYLHAPYGSTRLRAPTRAPIAIDRALPALGELTGPTFAASALQDGATDLLGGFAGEAIGERIFVSGRVLDDGGAPVAGALVEVWQCNASGRYRHDLDRHDAPLDPNFNGAGHCITDAEGRYCFKTIRPGAYPWRNHYNAWRPPHIHFSLFGSAMANRLITQMYFQGDPLLDFDPVFHSVPDGAARERLIASLDWAVSQNEYALGYRFDIVLRGRLQTPWERE